MNNLLAVFIGGGLGSLVRYGLSQWLGTHASGFPIGTFCANVLSCIVLGWGWIYFSEQINLNVAYKLLILVGFCGGFSTFSTFSLETFRLLQNGQLGVASLYVIFSILMCLFTLLVIANMMKQGL